MAKLEVKGKDGKNVGQVELGEKLAKATASAATLHRTVVAEMANARQGTQEAKTRSEVRGGGRKPYKQKKTGNARQGTIRAPHYAHGGVALAVKPRDYDKKVNKKERRAAILTVLASKLESGDVTIVDSILFEAPKTKDALGFIKAMGMSDVHRLLIVLPQYDESTYRSFRNIASVTVRTAPSSQANGAEAAKTSVFSARDLMVAHKILIAKDALAKIEEVWAQ